MSTAIRRWFSALSLVVILLMLAIASPIRTLRGAEATPTQLATTQAVTQDVGFEYIDMKTPREGWAWVADRSMDENRYLVHTQDGGRTWKNVTPPRFSYSPVGGSGFFDFALNGSHMWIFQGDSLWRTSNAGSSWAETRTNFFASDHLLLGVNAYFLTPERGWVLAVDNHGMSDYTVRSYQTVDGGASWKPFDIGGDKDNFGLAFAAENDGWSIAETWFDGASHIYHSRNGKVLDVSFPDPGPTCGFYGGDLKVFNPGSLTVLFTCTGNLQAPQIKPSVRIYHTDNDGKTWQITSTTPEMQPVHDENTPIVMMLSATVGWAVAVEGNTEFLYQTLDGGKTWNKMSPFTGFSEYFDFVDANTGWAIDESGKLRLTANGGRTWTPLNALIALGA